MYIFYATNSHTNSFIMSAAGGRLRSLSNRKTRLKLEQNFCARAFGGWLVVGEGHSAAYISAAAASAAALGQQIRLASNLPFASVTKSVNRILEIKIEFCARQQWELSWLQVVARNLYWYKRRPLMTQLHIL